MGLAFSHHGFECFAAPLDPKNTKTLSGHEQKKKMQKLKLLLKEKT